MIRVAFLLIHQLLNIKSPRWIPGLFCFLACTNSYAQPPADSFSVKEAQEILQFLASDSLKGRGNFTPELQNAAELIAARFEKAGLKPVPGGDGFLQAFVVAGREKEPALQNVVGVLEWRSRPGELVIFSAHYDHVGREGTSIYHGANDNASGTTALLLLAQYYARRNDNERTLVFCAFSGEERGLLGSQSLAQTINAEQVTALLNIEMVGIPQFGRKTLMVTGPYESDMARIMERNLKGKFHITGDQAPARNLFARSDNYPFALLGIPAHSVMGSDDQDDCYHQVCDTASRIDFSYLISTAAAIAQSMQSIISGKDTPKRISIRKAK